ncbi:ceramidase [Nitzschia inconspicua]|uniref:Ceramidase n=1 Tax=Nitzschia inconspicua TaxID=303405 RepID=A0A9K3KKY2_9STRA|nr:ceramidase [Nitzschia inconspicua]
MEIILPKEGQWAGLESHHCDEFCENSDKCDHSMDERPTMQQPVNAYSNIAYIWCGVVPMVFFRVDLSTTMYFCSSALLGISSFMYHASISRLWMNLDSSSMYTYFAVLVMHGLCSVFGLSWRCLCPIFVAILIAMPFVRPTIPFSRETEKIIYGQVLAITVLSLVLVLANIYKIVNQTFARTRSQGQHTYFASIFILLLQIFGVISVALFPGLLCAIATVGWNNDREKRWCRPNSIFQWHALWHALTAIASLWVWIFFDRNRLKDILATSGHDVMRYDGHAVPCKKDLSKNTSLDDSIDDSDQLRDEEEGANHFNSQ